MARHGTKRRLLAFRLFVAASMLASTTPARAHVEADMPDAVVEMEYRILLEFNPQDIKTLLKLGMVHYRQNKLPEAIEEFNRVLILAPDNVDALDSMGLVLLKQKKPAPAIELFRRAATLQPADSMVHFHLGQALEEIGDFPAAAKAYRIALEKDGQAVAAGNKDHAPAIQAALQQLQDKMKNAPRKAEGTRQ